MDVLLSKTHHHKSPKQAKKARTRMPIKVVYISNPLRVEATVSEFREIVQQLTGRDSDVTGEPVLSPVATPIWAADHAVNHEMELFESMFSEAFTTPLMFSEAPDQTDAFRA